MDYITSCEHIPSEETAIKLGIDITKMKNESNSRYEKIIDTIPSYLKSRFWPQKNAPDLIKEYDVVGFEVEHCLAKYHTIDVTRSGVKTIL
jgi:hypothetical protein